MFAFCLVHSFMIHRVLFAFFWLWLCLPSHFGCLTCMAWHDKTHISCSANASFQTKSKGISLLVAASSFWPHNNFEGMSVVSWLFGFRSFQALPSTLVKCSSFASQNVHGAYQSKTPLPRKYGCFVDAIFLLLQMSTFHHAAWSFLMCAWSFHLSARSHSFWPDDVWLVLFDLMPDWFFSFLCLIWYNAKRWG